MPGGVVVLAAAGARRGRRRSSRAMATIRAIVGTNWTAVRRCRRAGETQHAQARTPSSAQKTSRRGRRRAAQQAADGGARRAAVAVGEAGAAGVVVGDEDEGAGLAGVAPGDDVLRGAPAEQAADGGDQEAGVEERQQGGRQGEGAPATGTSTARTLAAIGGRGEQRVGERPGWVDRERLERGVAAERLEPLLEVLGGAALGVAAGARPAEVDDGVELGRADRGLRPRAPMTGWGVWRAG